MNTSDILRHREFLCIAKHARLVLLVSVMPEISYLENSDIVS